MIRLLEEAPSVSTNINSTTKSLPVVKFSKGAVLSLKDFPLEDWENKLKSYCECYKNLYV